jgi:NADH dehydrogenase
MNVLVTGGTGFVGREIARQLHNRGHRVHMLTRNPEASASRDAAAVAGAKTVPGNVLDAGSLKNVCAGVEAIIHLVGIISEIGEQTFENVHIHGTQNMLAAAQQAGVKRFLHMSALGARPDAASRYHQSKWAAEERVRRSGLGWTIFRPSIIYGPGDGFVTLFARIARFSPVVPVIGGRTRFQPVPVKSVALAFLGAVDGPHTVGETYDLCGEETLTLDEMVDHILAATQRKRLKLPLPAGVAGIQAAFLEFVFPSLLRRAPPLTRDQILMLQEDNVGSPEPAQTLFGLKSVPFREGIAGYLRRET